MVLDGVAAISRFFGFRETLIAPVAILDAVAVVMVLPGQPQTVGPLVRILDRVARPGVCHGLPHPDYGDHTKRHKETTSRHIGEILAAGHAPDATQATTLGMSEPQCLQRMACGLIVSAQKGQTA